MNIPADRMYAANWVLQCSILSFMFNLVSVPYNAVFLRSACSALPRAAKTATNSKTQPT
jgi:hypothetical protein